MFNYILKRVFLAIPTLLIASLIVFIMVRILPGDPAALMLGDMQDARSLEQMRAQLGLDKPIVMQYLIWLSDMLSFEFGNSIITGQSVSELIFDRFFVTFQLVMVAVGIAIIIAIPSGLYAALKHNTFTDHSIMMLSIFLLSIPSFWIALMLVLVFGVELRWLPTIGYVALSDNVQEAIRYLILPVVSLALVVIGQFTRMMRSTSIDILNTEFVLNARAKGLSEIQILKRHIFKNAFAPTLTIIGMVIGSLLGGAAVIETLFTLPGIGRLMVDSLYSRDYPVIQASTLLMGGVFVLVNLLVDLLYPFFDPRVKL
ncbi:ABC transporter permease [Alteromonas oceanisediminis]|uniref:ABC transporter permease n=1 Tax=Alteromonas oceanisediminis TaxID=2836180 RepID=UPI001BD9F8AE|nr:ABC transporter permease [Alteromonas oceanisediminis]MBT0585171.1 ABC transporter permease [Alteromonas oceanisediminis]